MLTDSRVRDLSVSAGYRDIVPGSHSSGQMAQFVMFVLENRMEDQLLPAEPSTDLAAISEHVEKVCKRLRPEISVPGVSAGRMATFLIFAKEHRLWDTFRNDAETG